MTSRHGSLILFAVWQLGVWASSSLSLPVCPLGVSFNATHPEQCDRYFHCSGNGNENGARVEMLCPDGLVFSDRDLICDFPFRINCLSRPVLQRPAGKEPCFRQNGRFPHAEFCDQYYQCENNFATSVTCPFGLIFDSKSGRCQFPDIALRSDCLPEELLEFYCPVMNLTGLRFRDHERVAKSDDCRLYFKCMRNGHPRLGLCQIGKVFNNITQFCDNPANVPGCENYYNES